MSNDTANMLDGVFPKRDPLAGVTADEVGPEIAAALGLRPTEFGAVVPAAPGLPKLIRVSDVAARPVDWLWEPFIPVRMLSMLSGDPGCGKSFIALYLAAELSRGRLCDGRTVEPASTLYLSVENPIAETVRPRFDALGGDSSRLLMLKDSVTLSDVVTIEAAIRQAKARLVIVDPIQSYLGAGIDLHRSNETRPVMDGIARVAESCNCAIVLLRHLSKQRGGKAIHTGIGSIDLTGAVRSELMAGSLPDNPDTRAVVHIKTNIGPFGSSQGYTIDALGFSLTGETSITAADLMEAPEGADGISEKESAKDFLQDALANGPRLVTDLETASGINKRTLQRAAKDLGIARTRNGERGPWLWSLAPKKRENSIGDKSTPYTTAKILSPMEKAVAYAPTESSCGEILNDAQGELSL